VAVKKFSQITASGSPPANVDFVVGVTSSAIDSLWTIDQIALGILNAGTATSPGVLWDNSGVIDSFGNWNNASSILTLGTGAATLAGGTGASSSLILESTTGVGTSDLISFKTGSQVEAMRIDTAGIVSVFNTTASTSATSGALIVSGGLGIAGDFYSGASINTGNGVSTGNASIELGGLRTGNGPAFIDFHGVAGTDFEFRIIRLGGVDGNMQFQNTGAGTFTFTQSGAGNMDFFTNSGQRVRIDGNGNVVINSAAISTGATNGFLYIPTCAGTPTGTPTTYTGMVPLVYDTTNHQFWIYDSGWKQPKTPAAAAIVTWQ
jgi:hypothetical protein